VLVVVAGLVAMTGCSQTAGVAGPTVSPTSATSTQARPSLDGIDSANVQTVRMSVQIGPEPGVWVVDLGAGQAYTITAGLPGMPATTSPPRPLSTSDVADFRTMLDAAGVWTWQAWADANRAYGPAGNATVVLTSADRSVTLDLGLPAAHGTDGTGYELPGWHAFNAAMIALAGE